MKRDGSPRPRMRVEVFGGHFRINEMASDMGEYEGMYPPIS